MSSGVPPRAKTPNLRRDRARIPSLEGCLDARAWKAPGSRRGDAESALRPRRGRTRARARERRPSAGLLGARAAGRRTGLARGLSRQGRLPRLLGLVVAAVSELARAARGGAQGAAARALPDRRGEPRQAAREGAQIPRAAPDRVSVGQRSAGKDPRELRARDDADRLSDRREGRRPPRARRFPPGRPRRAAPAHPRAPGRRAVSATPLRFALALLCGAAALACAEVKPWERELLARR